MSDSHVIPPITYRTISSSETSSLFFTCSKSLTRLKSCSTQYATGTCNSGGAWLRNTHSRQRRSCCPPGMRRPGRHLVSVAAAFLAPRVLLGDQQTSEAVREFSPRATQNDRKLAVVVPVHEGDVSRALSSLEMWPDVCSPVTLANMDLVIYKAETAGESSAKILATAEETAGRCFARTKILHANLPPEVRSTWERR